MGGRCSCSRRSSNSPLSSQLLFPTEVSTFRKCDICLSRKGAVRCQEEQGIPCPAVLCRACAEFFLGVCPACREREGLRSTASRPELTSTERTAFRDRLNNRYAGAELSSEAEDASGPFPQQSLPPSRFSRAACWRKIRQLCENGWRSGISSCTSSNRCGKARKFRKYGG